MFGILLFQTVFKTADNIVQFYEERFNELVRELSTLSLVTDFTVHENMTFLVNMAEMLLTYHIFFQANLKIQNGQNQCVK